MFFQSIYKASPEKPLDIKSFQKEIYRKEKKSLEVLKDLNQILTSSSDPNSLIEYPYSKSDDIDYYVLKNDSLLFWSNNVLDVKNDHFDSLQNKTYIELPNAFCITQHIDNEEYILIALIPIKHNYSIESNLLVNDFAPNFNMDKHVKIVRGSEKDKGAIFSTNNTYLFSLEKSETIVFNETWAYLAFTAFFFFFMSVFFAFANFPSFHNKKTLKISHYLIAVLFMGIFLTVFFRLNIPSTLFESSLFSGREYTVNKTISSQVHLSIFSFYLLASIVLLFRYVRLRIAIKSLFLRVAWQATFFIYYLLAYFLAYSIILHIPISINTLFDTSFYSFCHHLILLTWGLGAILLYLKVFSWMKSRKDIIEVLITNLCFVVAFFFLSYSMSTEFRILFFASYTISFLFFLAGRKKIDMITISLYMFVFTVIVTINLYVYEKKKREIQYKTLIENLGVYETLENTVITEALLEAISSEIQHDKNIAQLLSISNSSNDLSDYLNETYLNAFQNNYNINTKLVNSISAKKKNYDSLINEHGKQLENTNFYSLESPTDSMVYIGNFAFSNNALNLYIEIYPSKRFRSYSFPNLLLTKEKEDVKSSLRIETAIYSNNKLVGWSNKINYPANTDWIPNNKSSWHSFKYQDKKHYVYKPDSNVIYVISELSDYSFTQYLFFGMYIFFMYTSVCWLLLWIFPLSNKRRWYQISLSSKFQYVSFSLFIISFVGVFFVSSNFLRQKYKRTHIQNIESKKSYIQKSLQDIYYWNTELNSDLIKSLNFNLQELSYTFHTDIHVYDNNGDLIASSQPLLFSKHLTSKMISPYPFFGNTKETTQYEQIGDLMYLASYSELFNGDYLPIGYISIPQYYSEEEIAAEIEDFLKFIIQIYIVIILISMILGFFIGKQLSAPLSLLEKEMRDMKIGHKSKKIIYRYNDEIKQLVDQYNQTVDELEKSAALLAQSERESAWRTMARQIAHEINNPLTPMKLSIQQLQRTKKKNDKSFDEYFEKSTKMLIEQIDSLSYIATSFQTFSRADDSKYQRVDIADRLYSALQLIPSEINKIQTTYSGAKSNVFVYANPEELVVVFNNLFKNAMQAIGEKENKKIDVLLEAQEKEVIIKVCDNGNGVSPEIIERLFVPNFTTKNSGMGLGLAITKRIIENARGRIAFENNENGGAIFIVTLPKL